ncbi:MAG TPA: hypothetical protein VFX28_00210, partial [Methylomirabilota bacterium]|nr:hypothetical protein [Methylomirabilota bacterium]
ANRRAAEEAQSLAAHSSLLATGDAYTAYLQMLRYADDPLVHEKTTPSEQRTAALQQLVYLNTNMFQSLTVADRGGNVLATTDRSIHDMRPSQAFTRTRANLGPTNSDIVLPEPGKPGYVDFGTPLKDAEGSTWAFLIGRAEPSRLWRATRRATVDASRNVIINSNGEFSTGVPNELLGQPWRGVPLENGSVRADIAGVDSICGLGAIGKDTQIDHGWNVASCLPVSLIQAQHGTAIGKQAQVTLAGAVLAAVLAAGLMRAGVRERKPLLMLPAPAAAGEAAAAAPPAAPAIDVAPGPQPERAPAPQPPPIVADVDALALIEAYEERAARLAARLRESVKARLLVAATQADEAYRLVTADAELAATLHARAMEELEGLRERDLRAIGQELHPGMV